MRVTRQQAALNRERVLEAAGRLLQENGVDGIGVDALMRGAGLTHGGFYKAFESKEALAAEACGGVLARNAAYRERLIERSGADALAVLIDSYLSERHCEQPGAGCAFTTLATDAARRGGGVRAAFTAGLKTMVEQVSRIVPGRAARRREVALSTVAGLVGAVVLARAVDDPALRQELLAATRGALGGHPEIAPPAT